MGRHGRRSLHALLLACSLSLGAVVVSAPPAAGVQPWVPVDRGCTAVHPHGLDVWHENEEERAAGVGLRVCTNATNTSTLLANRSRSVWLVERPVGLRWTNPTARVPVTVQLFRASVADLTLPGLPLEPGRTMQLGTPYWHVRVSRDPATTAAWESVLLLQSTVREHGTGKATDYFTRSSPTRRVVVSCAMAGYEAGDTIASSDSITTSPGLLVSEAVGTGLSFGECGRAVDAAEKAGHLPPRWGTRDVRLTAEKTNWLSRAGRGLETALQHGRYVPRAPG